MLPIHRRHAEHDTPNKSLMQLLLLLLRLLLFLLLLLLLPVPLLFL